MDSNATVTLTIQEWNDIQSKIEKLQKLVDEKKFIAFSGNRHYGDIEVYSGDLTMIRLLESMKGMLDNSVQSFKKVWDQEEKIHKLEKEVRDLKENSPNGIKK